MYKTINSFSIIVGKNSWFCNTDVGLSVFFVQIYAVSITIRIVVRLQNLRFF